MAIGRQSKKKYIAFPASAYVEFFRNTPLLVQIYLFYYGLPNVGLNLSPILCGILGLSLYTGAYITEVARSGLQSIAKEQTEAAQALGLNKFQTMWLVIYPQAIRIIIPPLSNQYINLTKNSSLVGFITVVEAMHVIYKGIATEFRYLEFFIIGCIIYMTIVGMISLCSNLLEHYLRIPGRT